MKKLFALSSIVLAATAFGTAHAESPSGNFSVTTSNAQVDRNYPNAKIQTASVLVDVQPGTKLGATVSNIDAWGDTATFVGVRAVQDLNDTFFVDASLGGSDKSKITVKERATVLVGVKTLPAKNLILSTGVDVYNMREGSTATALINQAVYYVPGVPLVVQADTRITQVSAGERVGAGAGVGVTYGKVGDWTVSARHEAGRVNYQLVSMPTAVADYHSSNTTLGLDYWVEENWGFRVGVSHVENQYYKRDEVRFGLFFNF